MAAKHRQLAPTVGQISDDPPTNSMAIFKFPITMPKEGTTFIFGLWVCVANAPGGFHSHLDDSLDQKIVQHVTTGDDTKLSDQIRKLSIDDQGEIRCEDFFNSKKVLETNLNLHPTNHREAIMCDETLDGKSISIIGRHLDLTIISTHQGNFMYWKGLESPERLGLDARLMAYIPDLPY